MSDKLARVRPGGTNGTAYPVATPSALEGLRAHAVQTLHETIGVVPTVLRRLGTFLLVGSIAMVAFAVGAIAVLVHAVA